MESADPQEKKTSSSEPDDISISNHAIVPDQMRHQFSIWSLGSLCLCLMASWEALASVVTTALVSGGAPCLFYNYIISFFATIAVASSLAEIASIYPSAGGQYHWVALLVPGKSSLSASWFTGWISCGGQIVLTASAAFSAGLQLQALVTLNNPDTYVPQRWHGMLFYWLVLAYALIINLWGAKLLSNINLASGIVHISAFIAMVAVLAAMAPKTSAHFVFVETSNASGWSNDGVAWLVGVISSVYPFLGYDSAAHISEETRIPSRDVPIAMVGSVIVNGIMGLGFCIILLFSLTDLEELLQSPTGFPFMQLILNTTKSNAGATILLFAWIFIAIAASSAGLTSTSRTIWAFARDNAIPFSDYFTHIDSGLAVPQRVIILTSAAQMLLGFLYLGSSTAFTAVLSMAILGMYASYFVPVVSMLLYGRKGDTHKRGPFHLGRFGAVFNIISIIWMLFIMVFSTFPVFQPVTPQNMNYCVVVMGGWVFFGAVYYFVQGRKVYKGPAIEILGEIRNSL